MKISRGILKDLILQELRGVSTGTVASQDDAYGVNTGAMMDKYQQYFIKMSTIFDKLKDAIIADIETAAEDPRRGLPRHLSIDILTDQFERFEDMINYKKQEIIAAERALRGEIRADVGD
jgi:hypothetical protein|tara:strand:+ start:4051 stop:4410 length:360 start_codon:yes stop_codon:yes gene_type:complete